MHAGLADTSLTLAVDPRLVRTDRLQAAQLADGRGRAAAIRAGRRAELGQLGVDAHRCAHGGRDPKSHRAALSRR